MKRLLLALAVATMVFGGVYGLASSLNVSSQTLGSGRRPGRLRDDRGTSMLPTYETGDLVITKKASSYAKGDIVAYRVPAGDFGEGIVVIHRIVGGSASEGFVLLGDNNPNRDDWFPKPHDIVGKAWIRIPKIGILLGFLHSPVPLASLAAAVAIVLVLFPSEKKKQATVTPLSADGTVALCGERS